MYKIPLADLKSKILASNKVTAEELNSKIAAKISELSGLISEEGAAHIIANELGIQVAPSSDTKLTIKEIYAGMRNITAVGKVVRKFEVREFAKGESTGKVCSLVLGDSTGTIRVVFWNEQVDLLDNVQEGTILRVKEVYVRDNRGGAEIHLGQKGSIDINPANVDVGEVRTGSSSFSRKLISELSGDQDNVELMGTVVQVFDPRFFHLCSQCNKRVMENEGKFSCATHGDVSATLSYVMNLILDDGSGTIRSVFWKNQTNHLVGKNEEEMNGFKANIATFEDVKTDLLGEQFKVMGRVKKNDMFDRLEFVAQLVMKAKPEEELARLENN